MQSLQRSCCTGALMVSLGMGFGSEHRGAWGWFLNPEDGFGTLFLFLGGHSFATFVADIPVGLQADEVSPEGHFFSPEPSSSWREDSSREWRFRELASLKAAE